jgi:hypothetical protein
MHNIEYVGGRKQNATDLGLHKIRERDGKATHSTLSISPLLTRGLLHFVAIAAG